jgi:hypothetical protein
MQPSDSLIEFCLCAPIARHLELDVAQLTFTGYSLDGRDGSQ